ncbi:MAG: hypothetical protein QMD85_01600 [Candidatus Aenigmarchaeota archaeon]|nr:hypothetical protein [Candidatus Aenigmarchaeota archaeon]MDI6722242.1 hypothetical protein [Candidatus Aenigmarchaeota archaeon]
MGNNGYAGHVVILEYDKNFRALLEQELSYVGLGVHLPESEREALATIRELSETTKGISFVSDYTNKRDDRYGVRAAEKIREEFPHVHVLCVTGYGSRSLYAIPHEDQRKFHYLHEKRSLLFEDPVFWLTVINPNGRNGQ